MLCSDNTQIKYCIDAKAYEQLLNNIRFKSPLEAGIEVVVYMLLYGVLDSNKYDLLDVSTMSKENFYVYLNDKGKENAKTSIKSGEKEADKTTDLVIVRKGFEFNDGKINDNNSSGAYAFIETKNLAEKKYVNEVDIQRSGVNYYIWTNGLKWVYRNKNEELVEIDLDERKRFPKQYYVDEGRFKELLEMINEIKWEE